MVSDGNGAAGRALVDSMLRAASEGTRAYGDALYWRGALAETAADAERDYRKVIVEYPLSPYVADALLSLAELEQARGDRAAAFQHLQRFVREHPIGPLRARAGLAAARLAFEQRDVTRGCAMIADARTSAGAGDVELRNQIDYYATRCPTAPATAPATSAVASAAPATTAPATPPASAPPPGTSAASGASLPTSTPSTAPRNTSNADAPRAATSTASNANALPTTTTTKPTTTAPTNAAPKDGTPAPTPPRTATKVAPATKETTPPNAAAASTSRGTWTIQLAAYNTRSDAEQLVKKLPGAA